MNMNKKIGVFLFALGLGVSSAFAGTRCTNNCDYLEQYCLRHGGSYQDCYVQRLDCYDTCSGIDGN